MVNFYRIVLFTLSLYSSFCFSQSAPVGSIDLAGYVRSSDGTYSRVTGGDTDTRTASNNGTITSTNRALVTTSKGVQAFDVVRTAAVDVARIGKAVGKFAIASGPVGMAIGIANLVCELSSICKDASDNWFVGETAIEVSAANCTAIAGSGLYTVASGGYYYNYKRAKHPNCGGSMTQPEGWTSVAYCGDGNSVFGCPWGDNLIRTLQPVGTTPSVPHAATQSDWDSAATKLNDPRFVPELLSKGQDIPTLVPSLVGTPSKQLSEETKPTKDSQGNVTGSEKTTTTGELSDGATAENPDRLVYREKTTVTNYDINNSVTNSTTTTTVQQQPEKQSFEIKFDEVPPAALITHEVPNTFASTSWGSGSCPPDVHVNTKNVDFAIPTQPICDTAIMVNPFILMLSTLIGIYIVAGVRGGANPS